MFTKIFSKKKEVMFFNFKDFLTEKGWQKKSENFYVKGYKTIKFVNGAKIMIALNKDKKVKYNHIVTCRVPDTFIEADTLTNLTYLK